MVNPRSRFAPPDHVLAQLDGLHRRIDADLGRLIRARPPVEGMRGSFGKILGLIPDDGARQTTLAEGAWITKQSLGERIREMESLGLVTTTPDPGDGRARLVRRTARGTKVRAVTESAIAAMEAEWAPRVGADRFAVFRSVLEELAASTDV